MAKKRLFVLAGGTATGGGSGFENYVHKQTDLDYKVVAVASHHEHGGVRQRAERLNVPFFFVPAPWADWQYRYLVRKTRADFVACSGWVKLVRGLDPSTVFNIHPAPLPEFGGKGMYGHHVHEAIMAAYARDEIMHTAICMHFVTEEYDRGPVFFRVNIPIQPDDTLESLGKRANALEHLWQPLITNLAVTEIRWSGRKGDSATYPAGYRRVQTLGTYADKGAVIEV